MEIPFLEHSHRFEMQFEIPVLEFKQGSQILSSPVKQVGLKFTVQNKHRGLHVLQDGTERALWRRDGVAVPFSYYELSVDIFSHSNDTLRRYLAWEFRGLQNSINFQTMADEIIKQWLEIREDANSRGFGEVFPLTIHIIHWELVLLAAEPSSIGGVGRGYGMVPASDTAIKEMLKRVKIEELEDQSCVICLEEFGKEGRNALQMPCLHVFHGECIEKWLKKSHHCPTCRFQMPTN